MSDELIKCLLGMQDLKYRDFSHSLMPTVDKENVIGIRTPVLRKFAKEYAKCGNAKIFMSDLPHKYYEENNLHAFLIEQIKDFDMAVAEIRSEEYYINMMTAWYFATALAKQYDATVPVFTAKKLPKWTHNKAIQKAVESFRVSAEHKEYLKTLKIK